ncbi:uncharacterized protein METZ01_LOCUS116804 [marine metagenome]|uniref:Major facilitator superfamily (MFS) profile domain-containing protein n=1 Tax=marine metagenome TaxID=408172 RepID=A0A381XH68_9ZZZZ
MSRPTKHDSGDDRDPIYGWFMVGIVFTLSGLAFGVLGSISVFLKPLATEFLWTRAETSLGYTAIALSSALFGVAWGFVADRFGTRWFGVIAAVVMAASLFMLSKQTSIVHFYAFYFIYGAFGNALVGSPLFANVAYWFRQQPGLAIGITAAGGAFGQGVVPYLAGIMIESSGWREAYMYMACGYLLIALPLGLLVRESPIRIRAMQFPDEQPHTFPLKETEVLLWLSAAVLFCCNCMSVPIVHLVPLLTDAGQSLSSATSVLAVLMFSGVLGRILGGKLGDVIGPLRAYLLMSLGQTVFVLWFPFTDDVVSLYVLAVFFGFAYSGVMSSILMCTRMMVSPGFAARAMSITSFFGYGGMGMGAFVGGLLFDINGNYAGSFVFASIMGIINLLILSLFYYRIKWQQGQSSDDIQFTSATST